MLQRVIILALIGGLVYLNYTTPSPEEHRAAILAELQETWPVSEELASRIWRDVDYSNFLVCSFTKTKEDSKMITTGYLENVKLVNDQWIEETRKKLQRAAEY